MAELFTPLLAVTLIWQLRLKWTELGLRFHQLKRSLLVLAFAYVVTVLVGFVFGFAPLGQTYQLGSFFENWFLVGFGEELFFCGVLYTTLQRTNSGSKLWWVLAVAAIFALWHLPGYIARELALASIAGRLGLNLVSWLIFGAIFSYQQDTPAGGYNHIDTS